MIAPVGFAPLSEVSSRAHVFFGQGADEFHAELKRHAIFAVDRDGAPQRLDYRILSRCNREYAFIDDRPWVVRVGILIDCGKVTLNPDYVGYEFPDGSSPSLELLAIRREQEINSQVIAMIDSDGGGEMGLVPQETVYEFDRFDGSPLCLREADADKALQNLKAGLPPSAAFKTKGEAAAAFREWIHAAPKDQPRKSKDRNAWATASGLGRDRGREIWQEEKPKWEASFSD